MITIRRTTESESYAKKAWRAEIDLSGTHAALFYPTQTAHAHAFGDSPEGAIEAVYATIGRRACFLAPVAEAPVAESKAAK